MADVRGRRRSSSPGSRRKARSSSRSRISTGPTRPRFCCSSSCSSLAEERAVLLVLSLRPERDHGVVGAARARRPRVSAPPARDRPRRRSATPTASCSRRSSLRRRCPPSSSGASSRRPTAIRSSSRSSSARSPTSARSCASDDGWRFDHEVEVEVPPTVEKVILARLDRLSPQRARARHGGVRARAHVCAAAARGRRSENGDAGDALHELQRLGLLRRAAAGRSRSTASGTR